MRRTFVVGVVVLLAACGHDSMTAPTAPVSPAFGLVGGVFTAASRPLAQARVEALDGPQMGAVAVTDDAGGFAFNAIFTSRFTLRASKEGYRDQSIVVSGGQSSISFKLDSANNPFDTKGAYEVAFDADVACKDLPAAARSRTYSVSFSQGGGVTSYRGTLSGADFARGVTGSYPGYDWDVLAVSVVDDVAQVHFSDPPIWEHLTADADLVIEGDARGTVADTSHMSFAGSFTYCPTAARDESKYPECEVPEITCRSQSHQLTLTRK